MTRNEKREALYAAAWERMAFGQRPSPENSFIELEFKPSYHNPFNLQLSWLKELDDTVTWRTAEWDIDADWRKFYEADDEHEDVLAQLEPSVTIKSGTAPLDLLTGIIAKVRSLKIAPSIDFDPLTSLVIDGVSHQLSVGVSERWLIYRWRKAPPGWEELDDLVKMLVKLRKELPKIPDMGPPKR